MTAPRDASSHPDEPLRPAHTRAATAWPGLDLPFDVFRAWVDARRDASGAAPAQLDDLYLAAACALGTPGAVDRLLHAHRDVFDAVAQRVRLASDGRDELVQVLSERLFVDDGDGTRRIAQYTAAGPLRGWLRAVATRVALDLVRRAPRDAPGPEDVDADSDERLVARIADAPDAALEKESHRAHLRAALRSVFAALAPEERNLLRYALLDGLGIDELARIYGVHRATAARRLVAARDRLAEGVRLWLATELGLDPSACAHLVREGLSQVDLTLRSARLDAPT